MLTYSNDPDLKAAFVAEVKRHTDLDHLIRGTYGEIGPQWRGCAVGCAAVAWGKVRGIEINPGDHGALEREGLYPEWLAQLEDTIFEGLPGDKTMKWPLRLSAAIPVGVDIEPVKWRFCAFLMQENIDRVLELDVSDDLKEQVVDAIRGVLSVTEQAIITGEWDVVAARSAAESAESAESAAGSAAESAESAAESAESAAESAARSAARSAAESAASAARSAAESAESAARSAASAARSAAESAESAESAAGSAAYAQYADTIIELLKGLGAQ